MVCKEFAQRFPNHNASSLWHLFGTMCKADFLTFQVVPMTSLAVNHPDFCLSCEIRTYAAADILVGMHGAGELN